MFPTSESKKKILIKCVVFFAGRLLGPDRPVQILRGPFSRSKQKKRISGRKKRKEKAQKKTVRAHLHKQMWDSEEGRERWGREREREGEERRGRERKGEGNKICIHDHGQFNPFAFMFVLCFPSHLLVRNASRMRDDLEHKGSGIVLILFPDFFYIFYHFFICVF